MRYIDAHFSDPELNVEKIAEAVYVSTGYLSRQFKQTTNHTVHEYLTLKRISLASELLNQGVNVTEACELCGYKDYSAFRRAFKKINQVPPGTIKTSRNARND